MPRPCLFHASQRRSSRISPAEQSRDISEQYMGFIHSPAIIVTEQRQSAQLDDAGLSMNIG